MKKFLISILVVVVGLIAVYAQHPPVMHTIGDSTMASYDEAETETRGWGQYLQCVFNGISVSNHGKGGASSKSFYEDSALWPSVKAQMKSGDYLLIQFAHNDEKNNGMDGDVLKAYYTSIGLDTLNDVKERRGTHPSTTYRNYLVRYIEEARQLGCIPVLVAPICRMYFEGDSIKRSGCHDLGANFSVVDDKGVRKECVTDSDPHLMDYTYQMRTVAQMYDVPFVDMTSATKDLFLKFGDKDCHAVLSDGKGSTHLSEKGARAIGELFARTCASQGLFNEYISLQGENLP